MIFIIFDLLTAVSIFLGSLNPVSAIHEYKFIFVIIIGFVIVENILFLIHLQEKGKHEK